MRDVWLDWENFRTLEQTNWSKASALLEQYGDILKPQIRQIPDLQEELCLKEGTSSQTVCLAIHIKPKQVRYAMKERVERELEQLGKEQIITKV